MNPTTCWSSDEFRRHGEAVLELLAEHVDEGRRGERQVVRIRSMETLFEQMNLNSLLTGGNHDDGLFGTLVRRFLEGATNLQHPAYMAHQVVLTHGGSLAKITAMLAASAAAAPEAWRQGTPGDLVVLAPALAHYSLSRAGK